MSKTSYLWQQPKPRDLKALRKKLAQQEKELAALKEKNELQEKIAAAKHEKMEMQLAGIRKRIDPLMRQATPYAKKFAKWMTDEK